MSVLTLLQKDNGLANLDPESMAFLQAGLPGVPDGVVQALTASATRNVQNDEKKQQFSDQMSALNTFKGLVTEGIQLTPQLMMATAEQTGLPLESIFDFNSKAQQVMGRKDLDDTEKMLQVQQLGYELDRESRGILNADLEKVDYLKRMYKSGASREEIAQVKNMLGIKDMDDPMYRAELAYKQAQATIEAKQSRGEAVTVQDQVALMNANRQMAEFTADYGGYVPISPLEGIKVSMKDGQLQITTQAGTRYQCGEFTNRVWGLASGGSGGFGDSYSSKTSIVDKRGIKSKDIKDPAQVKPGMAFVMPIGGKLSSVGHVGLVASAPDAEGNFYTYEANANGDEKVTQKMRNINQMYGFAPPPAGKAQEVGSSGKTYNDFYNQLVQGGMPVKEAKAKAADMAAKALTGEEKKDARPLEMSTVDKISKFKDVSTQLVDIQKQYQKLLDKGASPDPITGQVRNFNPYDADAQQLNRMIIAVVPSLARGVFGEVGVLTDSDVERYTKLLSDARTPKDQAEEAMNFLVNRVNSSYETILDSYDKAGYDITGYRPEGGEMGQPPQQKGWGALDFFRPKNQAPSYTDYYNSIEYEDANY